MTDINESEVMDRIFRHANHINSLAFNSEDDCVFVKEKLIMKDGSVVSNLKPYVNYEMPFWITTQRFRNHKQKKERELLNKLSEFRSNRRTLVTNIKRAIQNPYLGDSLRDVNNSPFVYGTDIEVESFLYNDYKNNRKTDKNLKYEYGAYDIETYVADSQYQNDPIMASLVTDKIIQTTLHKHFVARFGDKAETLIRNTLKRELGEYLDKFGMSFELEIVDDPGLVAKRSIERIHQTELDIVGIWNMDFDIPRILDTLIKYNYSPDDVFSDPSVPKEYRTFNYVQGPKTRVTDAGKIMPLGPAERWNYTRFPSKWNLIDSMCVYADLRKAEGKESYALDAVLKKKIKRGKLKFDKADNLHGLEWHVFMQHNYPIEYVVYNIFDCLGMILLDHETNDMSTNFPLLIGSVHISNAMSNPRKFRNDSFFRLLEDPNEPSVLGSTGHKEIMKLELDEKLPDKRGWTMTLSANMMERCGINVIKDIDNLKSTVFIHNSDLDIEGTYPNLQVICNGSKETTRYEVQSIEGVNWEQRRRFGVLMNAGEVNALQLAHDLFKFPTLDELLEAYLTSKA